MGKKYQKYRGASVEAAPPSQEQLAQQEELALKEMQAGRFRKARELYKLLCKGDKAKYLPGLIDANRCLASQLIEKGQVSEAQQVIAYLRTIAPASDLLFIELDTALSGQNWERSFACAIEILKSAGAMLEDSRRCRVADALVLSFPNLQAPGIQLPEPIGAQLAAVLDALRGVSESAFDHVQELIRPVPRNSIFAHWKMLIKALIAFYSGDAAKARALFGVLQSGDTPGRVARSFGAFLGAPFPTNSHEERDAAMLNACRLLGMPAVAPVISRANRLWQTERLRDSYREMRGAPGFPSEDVDLIGALSDFYFKACSTMSTALYWDYLDFFERKTNQSSVGMTPAEARLGKRMLGVEALRDPNYAPVNQFWRDYLDLLPESVPLKSKIASLVLERVGAYCAQPAGDADDEPSGGLLDGEFAIKSLEESIELDRYNLSAYFMLLDVYQAENLKVVHNRLLDAMTGLFPREKAVLLRAGRECIKLKDWIKGLDYLERAHELDRLDPAILLEMVTCLTSLARQHFEKGSLEKGRNCFAQAYKYALADKTDFDRGLSFLQSRHVVLEMHFGDQSAGQTRLVDALRTTGSRRPAFILFAHCYSRLCAAKSKRRYSPDAALAELGTLDMGIHPSNPTERKELYLALNYFRQSDSTLSLPNAINIVRDRLAAVATTAFSPDEAVDLIGLLEKDPLFDGLVSSLISAGLTHDPQSPRFRILEMIRLQRGYFGADKTAALNAIRDEAARRGDAESIRLVENALNSIVPTPFDHFPPPRDEEFEQAFDDEDNDNELDAFLGGVTPEMVNDTKEKLEAMTDAEFAAFRKQSIKKIPRQMFDMLFGIRPASKAKKTSKADPNQPDFFDQ